MNLTEEVLKSITSLARESQVLIFGEIHGTQEVPQLVGQLVDILQANHFGILGLELPHSEQEHLRKWALGHTVQPPNFFTHPSGDGRGNEQVLQLVREAVNKNWSIICFDDFKSIKGTWQQRDRTMAEILLKEWHQNNSDKKVICICGNLHSRLSNTEDSKLWPSFAANLQILQPDMVIRSIHLVFHQGKFLNIRVRRIQREPISEPYISSDQKEGHSLALHLPMSTPATHISKPPNSFSQFMNVMLVMIVRFLSRSKSK